MGKILLTSDETLLSTYRDIPLLDFLGCAPVERVPNFIYRLLDTPLPHRNGVLTVAPYALRKVEAALLRDGFKRSDVLVIHPDYIGKYIKYADVIGISTMDPYGYGPVTMMFTEGGRLHSYTEYMFMKMMRNLALLREKGYKFRVVVGGPGAWQLKYDIERTEHLPIDHIVIGEVDHIAGDIFHGVMEGSMDKIIEVKGFPKIDEIPRIVGASYKGLVEVMRGCGRNCDFCEPNLRRARYFDIEDILEEVKVNISYGIRRAWLHSEDIFLYRVEDRRNFYPNRDAVIELFRSVKEAGVDYVNPTHGTIAPAAADPDLIRTISRIVGAGPNKWIGIQSGLETGSSRLLRWYMPLKAKPFDPYEWQRVVIEGTYILNKYYWFPAYTLIIGLPGESEEDAWETVQLIVTLEKVLEERLGRGRYHFTITPLSFIPLGTLKREKFFDVSKQLTEARFLVIYYSWLHLAKELRYSLPKVVRNPINRAIFSPIANIGIEMVLTMLRTWARRRGFRIDRRIPTLDVRIPTSI